MVFRLEVWDLRFINHRILCGGLQGVGLTTMVFKSKVYGLEYMFGLVNIDGNCGSQGI